MMVEDIISSPWLAFGPSIFAKFEKTKTRGGRRMCRTRPVLLVLAAALCATGP
jgi:hypothetical protein